MKGGDFRRWALRGCSIYGEDQWFFLRELAQNARDAGAHNVRIDARREADREILTFADDGSGMDANHAEQFLFRLYASSKEDERGSAGQFGIGFWSVLRFGPEAVTIASNPGRSPWAVCIDEEFELHREEAAHQGKGTAVTLSRPARFETADEYLTAVDAALRRFCRYLRRNDRAATPLPVWFRERNMLEEISVPGPISLYFRQGAVEGAVGLGKRPSVELFARGLPVWKGLLLDELSYRGTEHSWRSEIAQGLAPCFVLNGNRLNVVMSRNAVVDDSALATLRRHASRGLQQLVKHQLQKTLPVGPVRRFVEWVRSSVARLGRLPVVTLLPILLALVFGTAIWYYGAQLQQLLGFVPPPVSDGSCALEGEEAPPLAGMEPTKGSLPGRLPSVYRGSLVERLPTSQAIALKYSPALLLHFKFLTATDFDSARGFVALSRVADDLPYVAPPCLGPQRVDVSVRLNDTGLISLPVPTGHALIPDSLGINGRSTTPAAQTPVGEPLVKLAGPARLNYQTCQTAGDAAVVSGNRVAASTRLTAADQESLALAADQPIGRRVATVLAIVRAHIRYDDSEAAAELFASLDEQSDWLGFVLAGRRGDCDVMNALAILLLEELGVPARLAIGGVGRRGHLLAGLHAWVEYYDGGWRVADASEGQNTAAADAIRVGGPEAAVGPGGSAVNSAQPESGARAGGSVEHTAAGVPSRPGEPTAVGIPVQESSEVLGTATESHWHLWLAGLLICGLLLALTARRSGAGRGARVATSLDGDKAEELLGDMALSAALQPAAWAHAEALWGHPLLPLIGRQRRLSLRQAERRAARGDLFAGGAHESDGLASLAAAAGTPVLDAGNRFFGRLVSQMAGVIDLDHVDSLRPEVGLADAGQGFVAAVSRLLRMGLGGRAVPLVVCPGLEERALLDVDLQGARLPREWRQYRRFVAIRPDEELGELVARDDAGDPGARLALVDLVTRRSRYYRKDGAAVRDRCARTLLKEEEG